MSVFWGGRARRSCKTSSKLVRGKMPGFSEGSPVVLRCHVCCDSALQFLKTFCWVECNPPFPPALSRLLVERFGNEKKVACVREEKLCAMC